MEIKSDAITICNGKDGAKGADGDAVFAADGVESVALTDKSVAKGGTATLVPTFTPATATNKNVT